MQSRGGGGGLTRRQFVTAAAVGGAALALGCAARNHGNWDFLSDAEALTLAALCDAIIPADDFPSASQAGAVVYIDRQLARAYKRRRNQYRHGLEEANAISRKRFGQDLAALTANRQAKVVAAIERQNQGFFELLRNHTLEGYYGSPRHGGNRDAVSWRMLGLAMPPVLGRARYKLQEGPTP